MGWSDLPLDEWVQLFGDDDPWSVSPSEWDYRLNSGRGVPRGSVALTDLEYREMVRDDDESPTGQAIRRIDERVALLNREKNDQPVEPDTLSDRLATAIRFRRVSTRLRLREVSRMTGISSSLLSRIELGTRQVTVGELESIANALGSTPSALLERAQAVQATR